MEAFMALLIPIIGIIVGNATVVAIVWFIVQSINKRKKLEHEERMLAIEKGAEIPIAPPKEKNPYIWPFVFIGAGLALTIGGIVYTEWIWVLGLILMFIGGGMLAARLLLKKHKAENSSREKSENKEGNKDVS